MARVDNNIFFMNENFRASIEAYQKQFDSPQVRKILETARQIEAIMSPIAKTIAKMQSSPELQAMLKLQQALLSVALPFQKFAYSPEFHQTMVGIKEAIGAMTQIHEHPSAQPSRIRFSELCIPMDNVDGGLPDTVMEIDCSELRIEDETSSSSFEDVLESFYSSQEAENMMKLVRGELSMDDTSLRGSIEHLSDQFMIYLCYCLRLVASATGVESLRAAFFQALALWLALSPYLPAPDAPTRLRYQSNPSAVVIETKTNMQYEIPTSPVGLSNDIPSEDCIED